MIVINILFSCYLSFSNFIRYIAFKNAYEINSNDIDLNLEMP